MKKLLIALMCMAILLTAGAALAEDTNLTVSGSGTVLVESDLAIVTLGVREIAEDVLEAQSTVNSKIAAIRQALIDAGVKEDEINTDSISIYANYDYSSRGRERIVGYTAANSLSVRTANIDGVGTLIDAAFAVGANALDNVQFTVRDDVQAQEQALTLAVEDAMRKAEVLARAAGMRIKSIESIAESGVSSYDSMRNYETLADAASGEGTMVQAALVSVNASISMEFELEK